MSPEPRKHTPEAPGSSNHSPAQATPGRNRREPITTQAFTAPDVPVRRNPERSAPSPTAAHTGALDHVPAPSQVRRKSGGGGATWPMKSRRRASTATWPSAPKVKTVRF